ncbi:MAG TPA: Stp1/IreP family PP2C-type Ser/Thr phosphatase [Gemmatimonadaceae bacterium]|nr:Stp1/IreP family PP2C-type Ser/Thr phosphatase [Gemmatimonadaceae bacterium]
MSTRPQAAVIVHVYGQTDVGRTREHNEDAFMVADLTRAKVSLEPAVRTHEVGDRGSLFMVADGMGGAAAGEIASEMAVEIVQRELQESVGQGEPPNDERFATAIKRATAAANAHIHAFAVEHPEYRGMGTTATVAGILGDTLYLAQVGDSRAYLVRGGVGRQITKDQSLMQKLIEAGEMTEEEAEQSERRNIILQALGPEANIKVDLTHQRVRRGDVLVLCSDGLSGQVRADEIARVVSSEKDLAAACNRLIELANESGGPDNITVVAARFEGAGLESPAETDDVGHRTFPLSTDSGPTPVVDTIGTATTKEMPAAKRPSTLPPEAFVLTSSIPSDDAARRRSRGTLIAMLLLLVMFAAAMWWVYRTAEQVIGPAPAKTAPASATPASP